MSLRLNFAALHGLLDRRHALVKGLAALVGVFALASGVAQGPDQLLRMGRDSLRSHSASGELHIVEIDARSLQAIDRWPWPRRFHAQLIDRLQASGVRSLAFDVDFSSVSNPADDAALASALERAGGSVILPTFRQQAGAGSAAFVDNLPIDQFRQHAFLAAVTVHPGPDGQVRQMPLGIETAETPRPSLASLMAERQAEIGRSFEIDYSIDPSTIPRHSFIDVISGRVDPAALAGKRVVVGATAVEIGDRYAVPRHGILPGVIIQAIAAETLMAGRAPISAGGFWPWLLAFLLVAFTVGSGSQGRRLFCFAAGAVSILGVIPLASEEYFGWSFSLAPALVTLLTAGALASAFHFAERFRFRSLHDSGTGMPNLAALALDAGRMEGTIVVGRIDRFAAIAAGLGADSTINMIHRVADRLGFNREGPIYRIDEASLAWIETEACSSALAARLDGLVALMRSPVDCGRLVDVTLGFGTADSTSAGPKQQIANAALAAVHALRQGRRWERFSDHGSEETNWHLSLLGELDAALANGQVWPAYQPKLDLKKRRISSVEALVRWNHPDRGAIAPGQFIPLLEEHGRAGDLTLHVFDQVVADLRTWQAQGHEIAAAVNVSATLLLDPQFVEQLRSRLQEAQLPAGRIIIEVTESAAMNDQERAIAALESWRGQGATISIDDYGTGQSSLGYLQKLPASELKIDMSFVTSIVSEPRNAIMVRSTIALAHELGMAVVGEGVEDQACLALLQEMGCDSAQGWHIGRPMTAEALTAFLTHRESEAA